MPGGEIFGSAPPAGVNLLLPSNNYSSLPGKVNLILQDVPGAPGRPSPGSAGAGAGYVENRGGRPGKVQFSHNHTFDPVVTVF